MNVEQTTKKAAAKKVRVSTLTSKEEEPVMTVSPDLLAETRTAVVMRGIKEGALKGGMDKLIDTLAQPIIDKIAPAFKALHPSTEMLEPAVQLIIKFIFMMGIAELTEFTAPMLGKALPASNEEDMAKKGKLLALWIRKHAGEKVGQQVVEAALAAFPLIMSHFSEISVSDLEAITAEEPLTTF